MRDSYGVFVVVNMLATNAMSFYKISLHRRRVFFSAALRLTRRVVGLKDEFYNRYLIKGDLFAPIVAAFKINGDKYNLLNSAMIELFDFIRVVSASI